MPSRSVDELYWGTAIGGGIHGIVSAHATFGVSVEWRAIWADGTWKESRRGDEVPANFLIVGIGPSFRF